MKNRNTRRGFTLIELLVVVLIIGILAAVAPPQYQVAVEKSRAAEALVMLKHAQQATTMEYLSGKTQWPTPKDFMEFSGGKWDEDGTTYCTHHFQYDLPDLTTMSAHRTNDTESCSWPLSSQSYLLQLETPYMGEGWENTRDCYAYDDTGYKVCQSLASQGFETYDKRPSETD